MDFSDEVLKDIHEYCLEHESFSKEDILQTYGIQNDQYGALKETVLGKFKDLEPRKSGGFRLKKRRHHKLPETDPSVIRKQLAWEATTIKMLTESNLKHEDFEDILGPLTGALRAYRFDKYGEDRRGRKEELAGAVIAAFGQDLLQNSDRRKIIGKAFGLRANDIPSKWSPGKFAAVEFINKTKLPFPLAGIASNEREKDIEILEGQPQLSPLLEFQQEVKQKTLKFMEKPGSRAIVSLPTGAGKTRVAVESLKNYLFDKVEKRGKREGNETIIWLAHTEELCDQAAQCIREAWNADSSSPTTELVRFWGRYTRDIESRDFENVLYSPEPQIVISTPQRLINFLTANSPLLIPKLTKNTLLRSELVVIDEAHRAAADTYSQIIGLIAGANPRAVILGLTATPFREEYRPDDPTAGTEELVSLFQGSLILPDESLEKPFYKSLQKRGVLSHTHHHQLHTDLNIRLPEQLSLMQTDDVLKIRTNRHKRRMKILPEALRAANSNNSSVLYFGPTVEDAQAMTFLLRNEGVMAAAIHGETTPSTRRRIIQDFKNGRIKVLCNCEVLTTGFDAPKITHVVMGRPTISQVLYEQMIGRGLRGPKFGGTESVEIIDCVDNYTGAKPFLGYDKYLEIWGNKLD